MRLGVPVVVGLALGGCGGSTGDGDSPAGSERDAGVGRPDSGPEAHDDAGDPGSAGSAGSFSGDAALPEGRPEELGESIFVLQRLEELEGLSFFDHPWPSDARRDARGMVSLTGYPNPRGLELITVYAEAMAERLDGFSPAAGGQLRFTVPLDSASLPGTVIASTADDSTAFLIDISEQSPEFGQKRPIALSFRSAPGVYVPENTLSFLPAFGQPLLPDTRYAFVVTGGVQDTEGRSLRPGPELQRLLDGEAPAGAGGFRRAIDTLESLGVDDIVHFTVFTTNDPAREAAVLRDATLDKFQAPEVSAWSAAEQVDDLYDVYEGDYGPSPEYQQGTPPFATVNDGGEIGYDSAGDPIVQRQSQARFALAVPSAQTCPQPTAGYPVVLVAHGTGGDYRTAFREGAEATLFAQQCLATLSIDQIFHGTRPGAEFPTAELLYFNLQNPLSARTNGPQSAIDFVQLARLVTETGLLVPDNISRTGTAIAFDPDRALFFGHSQGGLNGPIFLGIDDQVRGGVLSAAAASIALALLDKTEPIDFSVLLGGLLGLSGDELDELDEFHPALNLAQTIADPSDGIHYARYVTRTPRPGFEPKSIFMIEGVRADGTGDSYAPPRGIEALAVALGLPARLPQIHPSPFAEWAALSPLEVPTGGISGNLARGAASGALAQYDPDEGASDGHFVVYQLQAARDDVAQFLRALADESAGRVPAR